MKLQFLLLGSFFALALANPLLYRRSTEQTATPTPPVAGPSSSTPGGSAHGSTSTPTYEVGLHVFHDSRPWQPGGKNSPAGAPHWSIITKTEKDSNGEVTKLHLAGISTQHPNNPPQVPITHIHPGTSMPGKVTTLPDEKGNVSLKPRVLDLTDEKHRKSLTKTNIVPKALESEDIERLQGYIRTSATTRLFL